MSFLSRFDPTPSFPAYTGPYDVGTQEVEIPISELASPALAPDSALTTVNCRIFYPCERQKAKYKPVYWLPEPQREYWRAYGNFLHASPWLVSLLSYVPLFRLIFHTTIQATRDAKILSPTDTVKRWPVMVFSHGLGGTKNAYSHICGSLASHGLVVVAADHRDGSAPIEFIKETSQSPLRQVEYRPVSHKPSPEVDEARDAQLKIRLWELGLIHNALLKIDNGENITNTTAAPGSNILSTFASTLDVHTPGRIAWIGHSFGAATMLQFVKSAFYPSSPLYNPSSTSSVRQQITPSSPLTLLDLWTTPLLSKSTSSLWQKPLPAYTPPDCSGSPPLVILSEAFFNWKANLRSTKQALAPPINSQNELQPHIFYPIASAHLSQSDFGPLFPWATRKMFKAADPERTMRLNVRAILESLRRNGISVTETSAKDMEVLGPEATGKSMLGQDHRILAADGSVKGWIAIDPRVDEEMNGVAVKSPLTNGHAVNGHASEPKHPTDAVMDGEIMKN